LSSQIEFTKPKYELFTNTQAKALFDVTRNIDIMHANKNITMNISPIRQRHAFPPALTHMKNNLFIEPTNCSWSKHEKKLLRILSKQFDFNMNDVYVAWCAHMKKVGIRKSICDVESVNENDCIIIDENENDINLLTNIGEKTNQQIEDQIKKDTIVTSHYETKKYMSNQPPIPMQQVPATASKFQFTESEHELFQYISDLIETQKMLVSTEKKVPRWKLFHQKWEFLIDSEPIRFGNCRKLTKEQIRSHNQGIERRSIRVNVNKSAKRSLYHDEVVENIKRIKQEQTNITSTSIFENENIENLLLIDQKNTCTQMIDEQKEDEIKEINSFSQPLPCTPQKISYENLSNFFTPNSQQSSLLKF
jgi:hypothetical protein